MLTSYSETTPSNFSPFLSIGMNPVNQDMCDDPTSLDACGDMVNDITNETFATATGPSNLFPSIILPSCVYARENGSSTHLHRPIPTHDVNTNHNSPSSSNSCSSIINSYSNSNIWEQPNRKNGNNSSLHTSTCYTSNKRPRTVSYTVYLDSSHRKSSQAYRPGSAPLQHNNLLIPEEDSDSVDENNEDPKEIQDDNHCVHQRRNKKLNSKLCARRFSQNYSSRGECTTDEKTDIGESAYNSMHATASRVEHFNNSTNHIIYDRKGNRTDQLMNTHINLVSTDLSEVSSYQCLTNLPLPSDRSVQHNENCSITRTRNISPSNIASSHLVNSLPNSPLNNVIITNETDQVVNSRVISQPPMPDVVPRLGLHMYNISGSNFIPLHHHSTLSQPRCSSVPLVQTSINLHQNYPQHQQQHSLNCCDLFHFHCSQVNNPSFSAELVCDTLPNLDTELSHPSGRIHLTLLARRLASVGDELMISQSRVIRSRYNLPSDALYNGLRRASSSILSVWGISFSLTWLFASPIAYIRQTIGLIGQSLPRGTNTIISDSSSNTPNRNNFSRRRTATYSGGVMNPRHSLQTTLHELHQPADDTISPVHIDEGIHQISGSSQSRFPTQPSIVSSLYANPYHHYHHICCHHCQFSCRHVNNSERNSSFQAGTLMTNHSEGVEIRSDDSD
ncbi:unnamed protein product [Heterobilharzia americana]|nr:unnamed protein product [Heterobilharzia americana]